MSDTKRYPTRMHEVLGVEADERFTHSEYGDMKFWLSESGLMYRNRICDDGTSIPTTQGTLVRFINHPERILRKPRMSEEQVKQLQALVTLGFRWLTKDKGEERSRAYVGKPSKARDFWIRNSEDGISLGAKIPFGLEINALVSWPDTEPLDIVATLKAAGVEVEG